MKNLEKLKKKIKDGKIKAKIHNFASAYEGVGAKYTEGLSTLIFYTDKGGYIAVLKRDDRRIDNKKLKSLLGVNNIKLCSLSQLKEIGFKPDSVSPLLLGDMKVVIDKSVVEMNTVYCGTGSGKHTLEIKSSDLLDIIEDYEIYDFTIPDADKIGSSSIGGKKRILTGDTPSGKLHLGHYVGTLENRVGLQKEYDTFILLANIHAYANDFTKSKKINSDTYEVFLDNLAVGIDPEVSTIFLESGIPELYELYGFFLTLVKQSRALRNPTVKEEIKYKKLDPTIGFIAYPILQAADILGFNADLVPVGEDQVPVIENVREIARDFNKNYGKTFKLPKAKVGRVARLVGTDGKMKMSKSGGNSILLSENEKDLKKKVMSIYTDPDRVHPTDPGKVKGNPIFVYHDAFNQDKEEVKDLKDRYKKGKVGDVEVKEKLFKVLKDFIGPIREKRKYYEKRPDEAKEILIEGTKRARKVVQEVVKRFRENIGINSLIKK